MISAKFLWGNVIFGRRLQIDAKNSNIEFFESALYMKSVSMPLSILISVAMFCFLQVFYRDYPPDPNYGYCPTCLTISLDAAESPSNTFLQITTETNDLTVSIYSLFSQLREIKGEVCGSK